MTEEEAKTAWQPIETCPGDEYGVGVIFALPSGEVGPGGCYRTKDGGFAYSLHDMWLDASETPTHWMHYPAPPKKEGKP